MSLEQVKATTGRVLGVDYGEARTGLAVSDATRFLASGIGNVQGGGLEKTAERVLEAAREQKAVAVVLGVMLAVVCCRSRLLDALLSPLVTMVKSTPVASFIILLLIWVGRDLLPTVIVVLMVLPVVWGNVCAGIRNTDPLLLRTARVFGFSRWRTLRRVYVPSVMPHFLSACRTSLGLAWKSGIAAEVLTVPTMSIGKMLFESKLYWEVTDLFAWTVVVILCSLIIEKVLMAAVGRLGKRYAVGGEDA